MADAAEAADPPVEEQLTFSIPMVNATAVGYALDRRWRIDPFYTLILASDDRMRLDRWVHTQPVFII